MAKLYFEADVNQELVKNLTVAVLGYGSQGRAQALNLRDSGVNTVVGLRPGGPSWQQAEHDGWVPQPMAEAAAAGDIVMFLMPDMAQPDAYAAVKDRFKPDATILFAHGFNVHYGKIDVDPQYGVALVAPKGPGRLVRSQYQEQAGVPCLIAVHQDGSGQTFERALAYAHGIGGTRAGVLPTSFAEETETDLFGEQAVLCGGATELVKAGFETLVKAGYQPEVAYLECLHELKLIVDLLYEGGFSRMHEFVSETAIYGDLTRGPRIVDQHVRGNMEAVLAEIRDGRFAQEWCAENESGKNRYKAMQAEDLGHELESVGKAMRGFMPWLNQAQSAERGAA